MNDKCLKISTVVDDSSTIIFLDCSLPIECSTHMLTENGHSEKLYVESIQETQTETTIHWLAPNVARFIQTFRLLPCEDTTDDHVVSFSITVEALKDLSAMFQQNYSFSSKNTPFFMIPGHIYNTNNLKNSKSIQPQLSYRGDINYPKTPILKTRADRSTHNAVISVFDNSVLGVRINESSFHGNHTTQYNGLFIDTRTTSENDHIGFTLGYQHFPLHYIGKIWNAQISKDNLFHALNLKKNENITAQGHLYLGSANHRFSYQKVIQQFYNEIHQAPSYPFKRHDVIKDLALALVNDAYYKEFHYFPTTLKPNLDMKGRPGDLAWTGGFQVIYPLAKAIKHLPSHPEVKNTVLDFIEHVVAEGIHKPTGFFFESKHENEWRISGWWKNDLALFDKSLHPMDSAHSAYVNGQACCYLLKVYQLAKDEGWAPTSSDQWFLACKTIVDHVIRQQRFDGALGVYFNPHNGDAVYYDSFQGAWFLAAIAELYKITHEKIYLESFNKANPFYFAFHEAVELWGTPMDTRDAVDEEGNLAYITALTTMHQVTNNDQLINQLIHAAHYEFSWKFAYNTQFTNEPLRSLGWQSCGGSITSSHNIHIHQMGNLIGFELYYLYKQTNDDYIYRRLKDTLNWGLGTHNPEDNYFGFGKKGWATEQFFHTDGIQDDSSRIPDGGIWFSYLSWAAACVLLSTAEDIEDEYYY